MSSSCNHIRLLDQRYSFYRSPLQRRNALRLKVESRFLTPLQMCRIRSRKISQDLDALSQDGKSNAQKTQFNAISLFQTTPRKKEKNEEPPQMQLTDQLGFKDQVLLLTVLRGFQTPEESMKEIATPLLKKTKTVQTKQKPLLQLFAFNKHTVVSQTNFQNRVRRTISQIELPKIRSQAPLNRSMSMNKSIIKIYGIKD